MQSASGCCFQSLLCSKGNAILDHSGSGTGSALVTPPFYNSLSSLSIYEYPAPIVRAISVRWTLFWLVSALHKRLLLGSP